MNQSVFKLVAVNPSLEQKDGYYALPSDANAVKVTFTDGAEEQIAGLLSGLDNADSFSPEFENIIGDGKLLSVLRPQTLTAFDLSNIRTALEISHDYGNVGRYLAEQIAVVECVKPNQSAARAAAYRCADLANLSVIQEDLNDIELPKKYYDLIVVSDIESLAQDEAGITNLVKRLEKTLSENGVLVLNVQNPQPISAWFKQDQSVPYAELYGTLNGRLSLEQWQAVLDAAGLANASEHCLLPNSIQPRSILSRSYVEKNASSINHFYGAGFTGNEKVNEYLLFNELAKTQNLFELCDSYLLVTANSQQRIDSFYNQDFTHFSSPGRRRQWRTVTSKIKGDSAVTKSLLFSKDQHGDDAEKVNGITIQQILEPQQYQQGDSLAGLWLQSLVLQADTKKFEQFIQDYYQWLLDHQSDFNGQLYDILPFNLIVDASGVYQVIDPEWQVETDISADFVLFRALFWFGFHNRHLLQKLVVQHSLFSLQDFVAFGLKLCGVNSDVQQSIDEFSKLETSIQTAIEKQFNQDAIKETLRLPISKELGSVDDLLLPKAQVFFVNAQADVDFANSVTDDVSVIGKTEKLSFAISNLSKSGNILRIDPVDRGGFFRINNLQIVNSKNESIWSLTSEQEITAIANLINVVYADSHLGSLFVALNDDPQLIFDLSAVTDIKDAATLSFDVIYHSSIDYTLAMQQLGQTTLLQQQFLDQQRNELESTKARYSELDDNFQFLKKTSEKQNDLIETLMSKVADNEDYIDKQQEMIETQNEMMMRTFSTRVKLFIGRILGNEEEPSEAEELEQAIQEQEAKPVKLGQNNEDYALWIKKHTLNEVEIARIKTEIDAMAIKPTFSIVVPVYDIDEEYLMLAVESVRNQLYPHWELCLVDDASPNYHVRPMLKRLTAMDERIVVKLNKDNQGIAGASNDAVSLTSSDYVGLLDHDDELSIDALYENAKVINQQPDVGFIYSDEDKVTMEGVRVDPFFKPDYSPDLLDSQNYICHFSVISQKVLDKIGGFRLGYDGSQDHDIIIRSIENSEHVVHIPKVLYHWRKVPGSTADVYDAKNYAWEAGRKAVESKLLQSGDEGEVVLGPLQGTYQVKRTIVGDPKVSIVIPFKDRPDLLKTCLDSIIKNNVYANFEVIGVSNNSELPETHELMKSYQAQHANIQFVEKNVPFNFSLLCNYGVKESNGEYVLLLNNDIEVRSEDWLECLLEHAQRDEIGAVGGKLFFPDGRIQHAGVVAGMFGAAGHSHLYFAADNIGYYGSLMVTRNVSAVTGAMLMVSRQKYDEVAGLDEENLAVAYNDVDLCLKLLDKGYRNIITPFCHAVHYESASRGYEDNPEKLARLEKEKAFFVNKWQTFLENGDPYFNPNFDLDEFDLSIQL